MKKRDIFGVFCFLFLGLTFSIHAEEQLVSAKQQATVIEVNQELKSRFAIIQSNNDPIWKNIESLGQATTQTTQILKSQVYLIKKQIEILDDPVRYFMIEANEETFFVAESTIRLIKNLEGEQYVNYVNLKKGNVTFFSKLTPKMEEAREWSGLKKGTFLSKEVYQHPNGKSYVSLYDSKKNKLGYFLLENIQIATGKEGNPQNYKKYVTITKKNQTIWKNFSGDAMSQTEKKWHQTFQTKERYEHYNGQVYLSLYDKNGKRIGYLNEKSLKIANGSQGVPQSTKKIVQLKSSYVLWKNFKGEKKATTSLKNQVFLIKEKYSHFNGQEYYGVFQMNGKRVGYINKKGVQVLPIKKLISTEEQLRSLQHVVQQKLLTSIQPTNSQIDGILKMQMLKYTDLHFDGWSIFVKVNRWGIKELKLSPDDYKGVISSKYSTYLNVSLPTIEKGKKYITLTFDDGPNAQTTPRLLNILKENGVTATFFIVGSSVKGNEKILKRMVKEGHELASHTFSHPNITTISSQKLQNEIFKTDRAIYKASGILPKNFRPPYGEINRNTAKIVNKPAIYWTIDTRDWESHNPVKINQIVSQNASNGAIILMHDIHSTTVAAVPQMIKNLKKQGYTFVTIDQLLQMQERPLHLYYSQTSSRKL